MTILQRTDTWRWLALSVLSLPFFLPFLWMVATAFKPVAQIYSHPLRLLPNPATLANFQQGWRLLDFPQFLGNSLWVTAWTLLGTLLSSSLVGFAFATLPARGSKLCFALLLTTMLIPPTVTLIPHFVLFRQMGWINTHLPLIVPHFLANPFYVFLFRQFFLKLPDALFESAELDGAHPLAAYWHIALPLAQPALLTVAGFAFIGSWNDLLNPLIYLSTTSKFTLSLGLALFQGLYYTQLEYLIPMSLVGLLPVVAIVLITQQGLVQGIAIQRTQR